VTPCVSEVTPCVSEVTHCVSGVTPCVSGVTPCVYEMSPCDFCDLSIGCDSGATPYIFEVTLHVSQMSPCDSCDPSIGCVSGVIGCVSETNSRDFVVTWHVFAKNHHDSFVTARLHYCDDDHLSGRRVVDGRRTLPGALDDSLTSDSIAGETVDGPWIQAHYFSQERTSGLYGAVLRKTCLHGYRNLSHVSGAVQKWIRRQGYQNPCEK
jgi:hypothetical protein